MEFYVLPVTAFSAVYAAIKPYQRRRVFYSGQAPATASGAEAYTTASLAAANDAGAVAALPILYCSVLILETINQASGHRDPEDITADVCDYAKRNVG